MTADGEQTKARLLTEARDLYLEEGFVRFSLREVARRAGVSAAAVYRHYDGKEALLRQVCAEGFRIFSSYLLRALAGETPRERLVQSSRQYLRFALENPRDYRVIFMGAAEDVAALAPAENAHEYAPTFQFLVDRVRECMQEGVIRKGDPTATAALVWANVHGLASLRLSGHLARAGSDEQFRHFYDEAVERLLAGLAP
jgi:AcrR family transcriptional regulator